MKSSIASAYSKFGTVIGGGNTFALGGILVAETLLVVANYTSTSVNANHVCTVGVDGIRRVRTTAIAASTTGVRDEARQTFAESV